MEDSESATVQTQESKDDNLIAALSHASIIIGGILVPLIILILDKDESEYVRFQVRQALVFQFLIILIGMLAWIPAMALGLVTFGFGFFLIVPAYILGGLLVLAYGLYGAYQTYHGRVFHYYYIGERLEKEELSDEKLFSMISHASIVLHGAIQLLPIIIPLAIWLTKKKDSEYVGFHSKQALVYQGVVIVLGILFTIGMTMFSFLGMLGGMIGILPEWMFSLLGFVVFIPIMLFFLVFAIYGLYGAYQVYQGKDFEYAIIGFRLR